MDDRETKKQSFLDVFFKQIPYKFRKFDRKIPLLKSLANKVAAPQVYNQNPFFSNHLQWLFLELANSSVIRPKGKSQNGCFKKTKHAEFSEDFKNTRVYQGIRKKCSIKKLFLKISQYSQENTCVGVYFNIVAGLKACNFIKNRFFRTPILKNISDEVFYRSHSELFVEKGCS